MSLDGWQVRASEPELFATYVKFTGAGAAPVVEVFGRGVTCTRTGVGIVNLIFDENMGAYAGIIGPAFEATAQAGVKGWSLVAGVYNTTTRTVVLNLTNNADTLADLAAAQQVGFWVMFKRANA